ncbi:MAG: ferrous iron transport protein [Verrucomicrobiales bacterium]|nr:ferrous iron transport protein [Verrucomicrobiales bacterium]
MSRSHSNIESDSTVPEKSVVVLTGNPNCGKTTLFNALTGMRARVGNYAGVTVERKEGNLQGVTSEFSISILDLPGTYSLSPQSMDEQISRDVLFNRVEEVGVPALVVIVVDASNLERNLYYATQVIELGYPTLIALNMIDVAEQNGHRIDLVSLSSALGAPIIEMVASLGKGIPELKKQIVASLKGAINRPAPRTFCELPEVYGKELEILSRLVEEQFHQRQSCAQAEALLLLSDEKVLNKGYTRYPATIIEAVTVSRSHLEAAGVDWRSLPIEARYARIGAIQQSVTSEEFENVETLSDKIDRVVTHKFIGMGIFIGIMALMFYSIFSLAHFPMDFLQDMVARLGDWVGSKIPPGDVQSLVVQGVIKGVGAVVVFIPQICLLFLFIGLLEDTGYMARAAFLMDRLMSKVGLHGKSFIPMLSSFACAIPGIMATRTIETPKDRLVTILVAPLMSCSARLPVYTLLIAACFPDKKIISTLVMLSMYLLGIIMALAMAWLFKKTLLRGEAPMLIMELPPYKQPVAKVVLRHMWDRSKLFLKRAGTVILGINIILWFFASYPKNANLQKEFELKKAPIQAALQTDAGKEPKRAEELKSQLDQLDTEESGEKVRQSFAGRMGRAIEPLIAPLGFDWKMGIGIITSFAAREVFVSTMSIIYNVAEGNEEEAHTRTLAATLKQQKRSDGSLIYTPLTSIALMVFYVMAMQCVSTVAVVRRETNSWKWPLFQWCYMGLLAWVLAFLTYQGGRLLGFT